MPAVAMMRVKKLTGLPLVKVKACAASGVPLVMCGCTDDDGLAFIAGIHDLPEGAGVVKTQVYRRDRSEPYGSFLNLLESHWQIDEEDCPY